MTITANPSKHCCLSRPRTTWGCRYSGSGDQKALEDRTVRTACRSEAFSTCRPPINWNSCSKAIMGTGQILLDHSIPGGTAWLATPFMTSTISGDSTSARKSLKTRPVHLSCFGSDAQPDPDNPESSGNYGDLGNAHLCPHSSISQETVHKRLELSRSDVVGDNVDPAVQAGSQSHYSSRIPV